MKTSLLVTLNRKFIKCLISIAFIAGLYLMPIFGTEIQAQNCTVNSGVDQVVCPNKPLFLHGVSAGLFLGAGNIHWTQKDGPAVTIVDPYDLNTQVLYYQAGTVYDFFIWGKCLDGSLVKEIGRAHV